ncbi:MAG: hypothetical protein IPK07_07865 [Deltaproteobacteria bacterium]|nr:hypothetical protein [Deltaproteobacteria bacterium]
MVVDQELLELHEPAGNGFGDSIDVVLGGGLLGRHLDHGVDHRFLKPLPPELIELGLDVSIEP